MTNFRKNESCPDSHELLSFQNSELSAGRSLEILHHLDACEFCDAEVEFYKHFPQGEVPAEAGTIPKPLFDLAEALLRRRPTNAGSLSRLFRDGEPVSLDGIH